MCRNQTRFEAHSLFLIRSLGSSRAFRALRTGWPFWPFWPRRSSFTLRTFRPWLTRWSRGTLFALRSGWPFWPFWPRRSRFTVRTFGPSPTPCSRGTLFALWPGGTNGTGRSRGTCRPWLAFDLFDCFRQLTEPLLKLFPECDSFFLEALQCFFKFLVTIIFRHESPHKYCHAEQAAVINTFPCGQKTHAATVEFSGTKIVRESSCPQVTVSVTE